MQAWKRRWDGPGGGGEVLRLAVPLIISNSFWTIQITVDRILLSRYSTDAVGAAMIGVMYFWPLLALFQFTASYATTFVAQYVGASRPERVGPVIWQALYFSVLAGLAFLLLVPLVDWLIGLAGHAPEMHALEAIYLHCLCFSALPMLLTAAATSFFLGRGRNWAVVLVNAVGTGVNAVLDYVLIFGHWGFPEMGIAGAGWATVAGSWASALLALGLLFRPHYRAVFATLRGWRVDFPLFRRLMWFGLPNGLQLTIEGLAFTVVMILIGRLGKAEISASSIAFTLNLWAFLPIMGFAQAVTILVGQRLGENRPDLAERSTWSGCAWAWTLMALAGLSLLVWPEFYLSLFRPDNPAEAASWDEVAALVPILLRFVALYCLFDSINLVFSFALKGAGDTRFVTLTALVLAWPVMVLPTWAAWYYNWGLFWSWGFISAYVIVLAGTFYVRFRQGRWKTMRVIEHAGTSAGETETPPVPEGIKGTAPQQATI